MELTILLQEQQPTLPVGQDLDRSADAQQFVRQLLAGADRPPLEQLPASAEEVVGCLQQLLGMLQALAPPVQLLMRLNGVLLQVRLSFCRAALLPSPASILTRSRELSGHACSWTLSHTMRRRLMAPCSQ
jgi:hypothetical protein